MRERARKRTRAAGCWLGARARSHLLQLVACDVGTQVAHEERRLVQGPAHLQGPDWRDAWQGLQVQFRLGSRRGIRAEHGHEAEAAGHVVVIEEDLALDKLAVRCEQRCEITGRKRLGEPVHEERRVAPDPDGSGGGLHRMGARHRARANPRRSAARSPGDTLQPHGSSCLLRRITAARVRTRYLPFCSWRYVPDPLHLTVRGSFIHPPVLSVCELEGKLSTNKH